MKPFRDLAADLAAFFVAFILPITAGTLALVALGFQ